MTEGKKIRLERILAGDGKAVVIAFDHGGIAGPAPGIASPAKAVREAIALAARAAQEIGADIVKTSYTGDPVSFRDVVEGCPAPVLILGGEKTGDLEGLFSAVYWSVQAGGAGIAMGRNIWSGGDSRRIVEAMAGIVHGGWTVGQAMAHTRGPST